MKSIFRHIFKALTTGLFLTTSILLSVSQDAYAQSCSGFDPMLGGVGPNNNLPPAGRCSPTGPITITWEVGYRNVDDGGDPNNVQFEIDWGDGTNDLITYDAGSGGINAIILEPGQGPQDFIAFVDHTWPLDDVVCTYNPQVQLNIVGVGTCVGTAQIQQYTVWGTDDQHGGNLILEETITGQNSYPICLGTSEVITFSDNSIWNCTPPLELEPPAGNANNLMRWIQIQYGTNFGAGNFMNGVLVNGVLETYPFDGPIVPYPATNIASAEITPNITTPIGAGLGDRFEMTIRYWNVCNPYDDGMAPAPGPNGDNPPVVDFAEIIIIDSPMAPGVPPTDFCVGDDLTITATGGAGVFEWYSDAGLTTNVHTGATFNPSTDPPGPEQLSNAVAGTKSYWVTETLGTCVGPDTQVDFEVFDNPVATVGPNQSLCQGTATLTGNDPGAYTGIWTTPGPATVDNPTMFNSGVTGLVVGPQNFTWTITNGPCTDAATITITRDAPPSTADAGLDQSLCVGNMVTLAATPPVVGIGTWTITVPAVLTTETITDPNDPVTTVTGLVPGTNYTLRWEVYNLTCVPPQVPVNEDFMQIFNFLDPPADAGVDMFVCPDNVDMAATDPPVGVGTWTVMSGPGLITPGEENDFDATITNLSVVTPTVLQWEVVNGVCIDQDLVTITRVPTATPNPSAPSPVCSFSVALSADPLNAGETGLWTTPGGANFADDTMPNTTASNLDLGNNDFTWTITNACGPVGAMISVVNDNPPLADAGPDQALCNVTTTTLAAIDPVPLGGTGSWMIIAGVGGTVVTPAAFNSTFNGVLGNTYTLEWTTTGGACPDLMDQVVIQFNITPVSDAGTGGSICGKDAGNPFSLSAIASVGTGTWTNETPGVGTATFTNANLATSDVTVDTYGTYTFRWTEDNNGCTDFAEVMVTFLETPISDAGPAASEVCDLDITLAAIQSVVGSTGLWSVQIPGPGTISFDDPALFNATATATLYGTYTLRFTESNGTCSTFDDIVVTYSEQPITNAGSGGSICGKDAGNPFALNAVASVGIGIWTNDTPLVGTATFVTPGSPTSDVTVDTYGSYTFRWTETNGGCSDFDVIVVDFYEQPVANAGAGGTLCTNSILLSAIPSVGTGTWTYTPFDGSGSFDDPNLPNATFSGDFAKLYTLQWEEVNGICIDNATVMVQFDEDPTVADAGPDQDICDITTTLAAVDPTVGTGVWSFVSNPDGMGVINNLTSFNSTFDGSAGETYILQWTTSNGVCAPTMDDVSITFNSALPTTTISGDNQACVGDTKTFTIPGGNPALYDYTWDLSGLPPSTTVGAGSGTPFQFITLDFFDPMAAGVLSVVVQDKATLCIGPPETHTIDIEQSPVMSLISSDPDGIICENESITFTAIDALGIANFYEFIVNGSTVQSGASDMYTTNSLPTINSITVVGTAPGGICMAESAPPISITVNPIPQDFTVTGGGDYCEGGTGVNIGLAGSELGVIYELYLDGNPTGVTNTPGGGAFNFPLQTDAGTYTVVASTIASCSEIMSGMAAVIVNPLPLLFNVNGGGNLCVSDPGLLVGLDNSEFGIDYQLFRNGLPQGAPVVGTGVAIDFGLQLIEGAYTVTATNPTTFCSLAMNGATAITLIANPLVSETNQFPQICSGESTDILLDSNVPSSTFTWTVTDSGGVVGTSNESTSQPIGVQISQSLENTTSLPATVTYSITVTGPAPTFCPGETKDVSITLLPLPVATISGSADLCAGNTTIIDFDISGGDVPYDVVYTDGTSNFTLENIAANHSINVNPVESTSYTIVSVNDANGCLSTTNLGVADINVLNPVAEFTADVELSGCSVLEVVFTNENIVPGISYEWSWGDGTTNTRTSDVEVPHDFVNNSSSPLTYVVSLTAIDEINGCENVASISVEVLPDVNIEISTDVSDGCAPLLVPFENNSLGVIGHKWFYRVKGTTDEIGTVNTPLATFELDNETNAGIDYEIIYEGFNGFCTRQEITEIRVLPNVATGFEIAENPVEVTAEPHVVITNTTPNKQNWDFTWNWGDGNSSEDTDPNGHTYVNTNGLPTFGAFEITLTGKFEDETGVCEISASEIMNVVPVFPTVDFEADVVEGCLPLTVKFTNLSVAIEESSVEWEFIAPSGQTIGISNAYNPTFTFFDAGLYSVRLSAGNSLGTAESETKENYIRVHPIPAANFTWRPDVAYLPEAFVFFQNQSLMADEFFWIFNYIDYDLGFLGEDSEAELTSTLFEPEIQYLRKGVKDVMLIVTNSETGCVDSLLIPEAVFVDEGGVVRTPNAFTPNDDGPNRNPDGNPGGGNDGSGFNNTFVPFADGLSTEPGSFHMLIYDRWGNLLFESWDRDVGWDGYDANGQLMPMGVYVYKLDLIFDDGTSGIRIGDVTLIR